jgi:hypothetical protein
MITASGEVSSWISFDGSESYTIEQIPAYYFAFVPVSVHVPDNTELSEYSVDLLADGLSISTLTVRVVLSVTDTELLQETSDMDEEISNLQNELEQIIDDIGERIDLNREDLVRQIMEMSEYNTDVSELVSSKIELEDMIAELQARLDAAEIENQNFIGITGQASLGNSISLTVGFLIGVVLTLLLLRRKGTTRMIDGIVRPSRYKRKEWKG